MKLKERIDRGQSLILEHKLIIERMEERLTQLNGYRRKNPEDPMTLSVISQIEFYLLNLKATVSMNESVLDDMIQQEKYEAMERTREES